MRAEALELKGRVEAVLVANQSESLVSSEQQKIQVIRGHGVRGDNHAGSRLADAREEALLRFGLPKGVEVANAREFSAVSAEEVAEIGACLRLPRGMEPPFYRCLWGYLGENLVVSGIPRFTELPPGTMLFFQKDNGARRTAVLAVWAENMPCRGPGEALQKQWGGVGDLVSSFPKAAIGRRGVVGIVYCSGYIHKGDTVIAHVPSQRVYGI